MDHNIKDVPGNISITFCSSQISLGTLISIRDKFDIEMEGHGTLPVITCTGDVANEGFEFVNATDIVLRNFKVRYCGAVQNSTSLNISAPTSENLVFKSSVYFLNSSNIHISNVQISNSDGMGLAMMDNNGIVLIEDCTFENNANRTLNIPGGGGLYIEFSYCTPGGLTAGICHSTCHENPLSHNSNWVIQRCTFKNNFAGTVQLESTSYIRAVGNNFQGLGRGGGLCVHIRGNAENNSVDVTNCTFLGNSAAWGGGLYIDVQDSPKNNTVHVNSTQLNQNLCYLNGGGGMDVGFLFMSRSSPTLNKIRFYDCDICNNTADYGGGTLIYSSPSIDYTDLENEVSFDTCRWVGNGAGSSAAVGVATHVWDVLKRGFLPTPSFKDCLFESNIIDNNLNFSLHRNIEGKGTFVAVGMDIRFEGTLRFISNNDTALYMTSSNAEFSANSSVSFERNSGKLGGALSMLGLSSLQINDNSSFHFVNNTAREKGGAIYQSSHNINDYGISRSCFIQYVGDESIGNREIRFNFEMNRAGFNDNETVVGHSIFAGTLHPCRSGCLETYDYKNILNCFANFSFDDRTETQISTVGTKFDYKENSVMNVIPGGFLELPVLIDELDNEVDALYHIFVPNRSVDIRIANEYTNNRFVRLYGTPSNHTHTTIRVETNSVWEVAATLDVALVECPPGYILAEKSTIRDHGIKMCECSATSNMPLYSGIVECNNTNFTARLQSGRWMGYETDRTRGLQRDLKSGYCPIGYCVFHDNSVFDLPSSTDREKLDKLICGERTGKLCANCRQNLSSHYHALTFECLPNERCEIGLLLYVVSEIIPITLFFLVIIIFNINFTKGSVSGLIFYFQVSDIIVSINSGFVRCPAPIQELTDAFSFITGIFNLRFFYHTNLSFCLWEGAQTLDLLAFRYVTILYSLLLVLSVIAIVRLCNVRRLARRIPKLGGREIKTKSTIIHGLSGFLIICYSESTKVSLMILTPVTVFGHGTHTTAAFYNGELDYFHNRHLIYAIPALLFLVVLGLGPPILLITYPLCYRIFGWLRIGETKFVRVLCKCIPLEKFKPLYDSFQSAFKDEFRFYSGVYFVYRLFILLAFSISRSITNYCTTLIIGFSIALCFHTIIQPYKRRWHNVLDGCIFTALIMLVTFIFYNYRRALEPLDYSSTTRGVCTVQTIVLYAPLVYFALWLLWNFSLKVFGMLKKIRLRRKSGNEGGVGGYELAESLLYGRRGSVLQEASK